MKSIFLLFIILLSYFYEDEDINENFMNDDCFLKKDTTNLLLILELWKIDSNSCLKFRNYEVATFLIETMSLKKSNKDEIINLLGPPNDTGEEWRFIDKDTMFKYIDYIFDAHCKDGTLMPNILNRCWLRIYFDTDNSVVYLGFPCS